MKALRKIDKLFGSKLILAGAVLLTLCMLIPVFVIAPCGRATGDDLSNSTVTHAVWLQTHSVFAVIKEAFSNIESMYYNWEGCYTSDYLYAIQPELFGTGLYAMTPFVNIVIWLGSTLFFVYMIARKIFRMSIPQTLSIAIIFWLIGMEFIPSTQNSLFWWAGSMHYTFAYSLCLTEFSILIIWLMSNSRLKKTILLCVLTIISFLLGGVNYQISMLSLMGLLLITLYHILITHRRDDLWITIPVLSGAAGLIISMTAPGNRVRGGSDMVLSMSRVAETIIQSIIKSITDGIAFIAEAPLMIAAMAVLFVLIIRFMLDQYRSSGIEPVRVPLIRLIIPVLFLVYAAMEAPLIFADVQDATRGVVNMQFLSFLLFLLMTEFIIGNRIAAGLYSKGAEPLLVTPALILLFLTVIVFRHSIPAITSYQCFDYVHSGLAGDFRSQMDAQTQLLEKAAVMQSQPHDGELVVYVAPVNYDQGPLQHMPIIEKEHAFTNQAAEKYYGIDTVVMTYDETLIGQIIMLPNP